MNHDSATVAVRAPLRTCCPSGGVLVCPLFRWWKVRNAEYFGEANFIFDNKTSGATYAAGSTGCKLLEVPKSAMTAIDESDQGLIAG
eukprot:5530789-Prymnesium_polylepis.1